MTHNNIVHQQLEYMYKDNGNLKDIAETVAKLNNTDGSVLHQGEKAWGGGNEHDETNPNRHITSTREEAIGIVQGMKWAKENWNGDVVLYLDNKSAVDLSSKILYRREATWNKTAAHDVWRHYHFIKRNTNLNIDIRWIRSHAERRKAKKDWIVR